VIILRRIKQKERSVEVEIFFSFFFGGGGGGGTKCLRTG
jgi:hypothetical protein